MNLTLRTFREEDDTWRIRAFLRDVFLRNGRRERSWHVNRFDTWRWHGVENLEHYHSELGVLEGIPPG